MICKQPIVGPKRSSNKQLSLLAGIGRREAKGWGGKEAVKDGQFHIKRKCIKLRRTDT